MKMILNVLILFIVTFSAFGAKVGDDLLKVGLPGSVDNKTLKLGDVREIRSNEASGKLEFTNDGSNYKAIGSGSGGGGGEGFNNAFTSDDNPNAEGGTTGWTISGGTFALDTTDPLEGDASFTYTPSAQNDYAQGPLLNVNKDIFKGRACQAQIEYVGGDENLSLRIIDGGGNLFKEIALPVHTISAAESVYFLCPSASEILANSDLAQLRIRIANTGASASPLIKWDKSYLGTLIGLSESVLPDVFSARISNNGTASVVSTMGDWIDSVSRTSVGNVVINLKSGLFNFVPAVAVSVTDSDRYNATVLNSSASVITVRTHSDDGGTSFFDINFNIHVTKQGTDAKQSIQVYKSIPKVSENVNELSLETSGLSTGITTQNVVWSSGVSNSSVGRTDIATSSFSVVPSCVCNVIDGSADQCNYSRSESTLNNLVFRSTNPSGAAVTRDISVSCQKQQLDFKMPVVQPVLVNQVTTPLNNGVNIGHCTINTGTGATGAFGTSSAACSEWIDSFLNQGAGQIQLTLKNGFSKSSPNCHCESFDGGSVTDFCGLADGASWTNTNIIFQNKSVSTQTGANRDVSIFCVGDK